MGDAVDDVKVAVLAGAHTLAGTLAGLAVAWRDPNLAFVAGLCVGLLAMFWVCRWAVVE